MNVPEQPDWTYHAFSCLGIVILVLLYFFGVWVRSYIFPTHSQLAVGKQLIAAIPIGLITMGIYARSALPAIFASPKTIEFDVPVALGYAIVFGMLSRESLERLLHNASLMPGLPQPPAALPLVPEASLLSQSQTKAKPNRRIKGGNPGQLDLPQDHS
jgi:hypothetical protein